jgi:phosphatidylglycerol:prolipoprotein diacylglycerol transferase
VFALLVLGGFTAGAALYLVQAPRWLVDRKRAAEFILYATAGGFLGAHVARLAYGVSFESFTGMASFGGIFGGLGSTFLWFRLSGAPRQEAHRMLDLLAWCFPFAWIFGRLGCVSAQDHPGVLSSHWLAVSFLDGHRFDLALIEIIFTSFVAVAFLLLRTRRLHGIFLPAWLTLYGVFRIALDLLHENPPRWLGITPDQAFGMAAFVTGLALGLRLPQRTAISHPISTHDPIRPTP